MGRLQTLMLLLLRFLSKKKKNCNARLQNWSIYISSLISHYITELRFFFGLMIRCAWSVHACIELKYLATFRPPKDLDSPENPCWSQDNKPLKPHHLVQEPSNPTTCLFPEELDRCQQSSEQQNNSFTINASWRRYFILLLTRTILVVMILNRI